MEKNSSYLYLIPIIVFAALLHSCSNWTDQNIRESQRRGDEVMLAINKYFQMHNRYPEKLSGLVPDFIKKVVPPVAGNGTWDYVNEGNDFYLGFWGPDPDKDPVCYKTSTGGWYMDTR